jgi:hypothetical protein
MVIAMNAFGSYVYCACVNLSSSLHILCCMWPVSKTWISCIAIRSDRSHLPPALRHNNCVSKFDIEHRPTGFENCGAWISQCDPCMKYSNSVIFSVQLTEPFKAQWLLYVPPALTCLNSAFCPQRVSMCFVWFSQ